MEGCNNTPNPRFGLYLGLRQEGGCVCVCVCVSHSLNVQS